MAQTHLILELQKIYMLQEVKPKVVREIRVSNLIHFTGRILVIFLRPIVRYTIAKFSRNARPQNCEKVCLMIYEWEAISQNVEANIFRPKYDSLRREVLRTFWRGHDLWTRRK